MKKIAWLLTFSFFVLSVQGKSTLKPTETLNANSILDSVKRAAPVMVVKDTGKVMALSLQPKQMGASTVPVGLAPASKALPAKSLVEVSGSTNSQTTTQESNLVKRFKILNRPLNRDEAKYFLTFFQIDPATKPESSAVNTVWRGKPGIGLSYEVGTSEIAYSNENVPMLNIKEILPDSLIRIKTDELLKKIMQSKAERYTFANYEVTMVQKKDPERNDSIEPAVPAFYIGRYVRKLEGRVVLGDAFQIRLGYGEGGAVQAFSFRDPILVEGAAILVPTKEKIIDSLKRWEKSKTHTRAYAYPYHADKLNIKSLKPIKVFDSYVIASEKFRQAPDLDGNYLVPSVTVLAKVTVSPSKKKNAQPLPPDPIILHFHFPCRPEVGLCWPDGNQDLMGVSNQVSQIAPNNPNPLKPVLDSIPSKTGTTRPK
jgi:hypothetical protein